MFVNIYMPGIAGTTPQFSKCPLTAIFVVTGTANSLSLANLQCLLPKKLKCPSLNFYLTSVCRQILLTTPTLGQIPLSHWDQVS